MAHQPIKTPFDLLARFAPKLTPEDEAEARRLGVTADEYKVMKLEAQAAQARREVGGVETPPDIAAEEAAARSMRARPGLIKPRYTAPNLLVQAAKTPGEVAQMILFVICYVFGLAGSMILWGERIQKIPGIFQCVLLGLLIIPSMWVTSRIWAAMGERARDAIRAMVRFWPLTLVALFFLFGALAVLKHQLPH